MPQLLAFVLCKVALVDVSTDETSLILVTEGVTPSFAFIAANDPGGATRYLLPEISTFSHWYRQPSDEGLSFEIKLAVITPDGEEKPVADDIDFRMEHAFHRVFYRFPDMQVDQFGEYIFTLYLRALKHGEPSTDWSLKASRPFIVADVPASQLAPG